MKPILPLLFLVLAGCATVERPEVRLVNIEFSGVTVFETTAVATVRVENATPRALSLHGAVHRLYINGLSVGTGLSNEMLEVPALSSATQRVEVHLSNISMATRLRAVIGSGNFDYRIKSTLYTGTGTTRVSNSGAFNFGDLTTSPSTTPQSITPTNKYQEQQRP